MQANKHKIETLASTTTSKHNHKTCRANKNDESSKAGSKKHPTSLMLFCYEHKTFQLAREGRRAEDHIYIDMYISTFFVCIYIKMWNGTKMCVTLVFRIGNRRPVKLWFYFSNFFFDPSRAKTKAPAWISWWKTIT